MTKTWIGTALSVSVVAVALFALMPAASAHDEEISWRTSHPAGTSGYGTTQIDPGETVTWNNTDLIDHDVFIVRDGAIIANSALFGPGETWEYTFSTAGTYTYYCSVLGHNATMYGVVQVGPPPPPATDASFGVPVMIAAIGALALIMAVSGRRRQAR